MGKDNVDLFNLIGRPPVLDIENLYQGNINIRETLDSVVRDAGFGSMSSINYLTVRGLNYLRHGQQLVANNRDNMGYVFFTRPILNLTYDNLSGSDAMMRLRNANDDSILKYIRVILDPWSQQSKYREIRKNDLTFEELGKLNDGDSPLVDPRNPFIPILSNTLVSLTGWKDITINDYTSPKGVNNEQWGMADGHYYITESYELSSSFKNIQGDPVSKLFQVWLHYIIACRQLGEMNPYPTFVAEREFDYNTRIYRFIMDPTRTYIQKFAATIAFPMNDSSGNIYNYDTSKNFSEANNEISVTWKCFGADYNRPVLFWEFNTLVQTFCPELEIDHANYDKVNESLVLVKKGAYIKLKPHEKNRGVGLALPLINYVTSELEWWVSAEDYKRYILPPIARPKNSLSGRNNQYLNQPDII